MDLYFYSPSCGPCRRTTPLVNAAIEAGRSIGKVDVSKDRGRYIAKLFRVAATPAYVKFGQTEVLHGNDVMKELS